MRAVRTVEPKRIDVIIPIYGLISKAQTLTLPSSLVLRRYDQAALDELTSDDSDLSNNLLKNPPDFLLITSQTLQMEPIEVDIDRGPTPDTEHVFFEGWLKAHIPLVAAPFSVLMSLRLFKPACFGAGAAWIMGSYTVRTPNDENPDAPKEWDFQVSAQIGKVSRDGLDWLPTTTVFDLPFEMTTAMSVEEDELPFFYQFHSTLSLVYAEASQKSKVSIALSYFIEALANREPARNVIDLITSLEAMFLRETEGLNFRLSQRAANLIGYTAAERKQLFRRIKQFYDLRSSLVHGSELNARQVSLLADVAELREITRRCLLSLISLASVGPMDDAFYRKFDDMALDDEIRNDLHRSAKLLLHSRPVISQVN